MSAQTTPCSTCGALVALDARFCPECGTRLDEGDVRVFGAVPAPPVAFGRRMTALRTRSRALVEMLTTQSQARRDLTVLRLELEQMQRKRNEWLRDLGLAAYNGDDAGTERGRAAVRELDDRIAAKEEQMSQIVEAASRRVEQVRAESRPTELLEPPQPAPIPEPYPPPDEGDPPMPAPVPEPYPPPDEGTPPAPR